MFMREEASDWITFMPGERVGLQNWIVSWLVRGKVSDWMVFMCLREMRLLIG
jgi:hypothetical protein